MSLAFYFKTDFTLNSLDSGFVTVQCETKFLAVKPQKQAANKGFGRLGWGCGGEKRRRFSRGFAAYGFRDESSTAPGANSADY